MELIISFVLLFVIVAIIRHATKNSESSENVDFVLKNEGFDLSGKTPFESKPTKNTSVKSTKKSTTKTPTIEVVTRKTSKKDSTSTSSPKTYKKNTKNVEHKKEVNVKTRGKSGKGK